MSFLHQLQSFSHSRHKKKRLGRGKSSGHGGTSTRGHKGQRSRSGFGLLRGFEGGQMPLVRLLPKFGFTNKRFKTKYDIVNLSDLNSFDSEVNPFILYKAGLVGGRSLVKILGQGSLDKPLKVKAHHFSQKAIEMIKKVGGTVKKLPPRSHNRLVDQAEQKTSVSQASLSDEEKKDDSSDKRSDKGNDTDSTGNTSQ